MLFGSVSSGNSSISKNFLMNSFKTLFHVSSPFTFANLRKAGTDRNRLSKSWSEYSLTSMKIELSRISRTSSKGTSMSTYFLCLIPIWPSQKPFVSSTRNYRMNRKVNNIFYYKNWRWIIQCLLTPHNLFEISTYLSE